MSLSPTRPPGDKPARLVALIAPIATVANNLFADMKSVMRLALLQPDIPGNVGAILRTCACFGVPLDLIEPLGFAWSDRKVKRAGMDYAERVSITRHADWSAFRAAVPGRLVLLTARGRSGLYETDFRLDDVLLMGSESAGAPAEVHDAATVTVRIPIAPGLRSLNVSVAAAVALAEALRRTGQMPKEPPQSSSRA